MPVSEKRKLVLGIGNDILTDDGIGPKIVRDLENGRDSELIDFKTSSLGGLDILDLIAGYESVVLVDAIKTRDGVPGDVYLFKPEDFEETLHLSNLHDVNFLTALELGKRLGMDVPRKLWIIAVEIIEDLVFSDRLTDPLEKRYPSIISEVKSFIESELVGHLPGDEDTTG
jgi:hydrogenase maturation protease